MLHIKNNIIRHPAHVGTAPSPPPHAQSYSILTRVGQRVPNPSSTTRATPSARRSTRRLPNISRLGMNSAAQVSSTARATTTPPSPMSPKRSPVHYLWAVPIAFITEGVQIRRILDHIGVDSEPPHVSPARGPPMWAVCGAAQMDEGVHIEPDWDLAAQVAPDFEEDQRISW